MKKFDFVIGNPPYQEFVENRGEQPPVYNNFYDESIKISNYILLITPARFLFDAGKTPPAWNKKMLNSNHFKVLMYEPDSKNVFQTTDIKGGVSITSWNNKEILDPVKAFYPSKTMRSIVEKVLKITNSSFSDIIYPNTSYKYSESFFTENEGFDSRVSGGSRRYLSSSAFDKFPEVFLEIDCLDCLDNNKDYIKIIGRKNSRRKTLYLKLDYIIPPDNFLSYKLVLPSSSGSGDFGEKISDPFIGEPNVGFTKTFVTFGKFNTKYEAENSLKYVKCKFTRAMLNTKKVTQGNKSSKVWQNVPLQDFTENSDIDWSKSIPEIDQQLYKKYGLSQVEIDFIEEKVQEMK